jgi:hypothetical protein
MGIDGGAAGGSMLASGAPQGVAFATGAGPTTTTSPIAAADATFSDTLRKIADM